MTKLLAAACIAAAALTSACYGGVATGCLPKGCLDDLSCDDPECNIDNDEDGVSQILDCNDEDANISPEAEEICGNHRDDNCDNSAICDDGTEDADGDDYGSSTSGGNDCDDGDATINPAATEICGDGVDDNCDGSPICDGGSIDADGDEYGSVASGGTDCDDSNAAIEPTAAELCDAVDDNCDGSLICDAGLTDGDGDGFASVATGGTDCDDANAAVHPGAAEDCGTTELESCGTGACTGEFVRFPLDSAPASALLEIDVDTWLLGTWDGRLYRSTSGGASWESVRELGPGWVSSMLLAEDGTIVVGLQRDDDSPTGVWLSTDAGLTFTSGGDFTGLNGGQVTALAAAAGTPFGLWVTTTGGGLYLSSDGASTFTQVATDTIDLFAYAVAADPTDPNTVVVVTDTAVYRAADAATFTATLDPVPAVGSFNHASLVVDDGVLFLLLDRGGMLASSDFGASWTDFGRSGNVLRPRNLAVAADGAIAVASHDRGILVSEDSGDVWTQMAPAAGSATDRVVPLTGSWVVAGSRGVFAVGETSSRRLQAGLDGLDARHLAFPSANEILVSGGEGTLFWSRDNGASFSPLPSPAEALVASARLDANTLMAISRDGGILRADGSAFIEVARRLGPVTAVAFGASGRMALAGGQTGRSRVFAGTVAGTDLNEVTGISDTFVDSLFWLGDTLFAGARNGTVLRCLSGETAFSAVTMDTAATGSITAIFTADGAPLYAAVGAAESEFALYSSNDGGDTFSGIDASNQLTDSTFVRTGCIEPITAAVILVTPEEVSLTSDGGATFSTLSGAPTGLHQESLPISTSCHLRHDGTDTTLWLTTRDHGVWLTKLP